ncbi:MAG: BadF/BadG/BcrA/BcrD ATPase family protein [Bdellovibrionota bacterium]
MSRIKYFLGIDGGGSGTRIVVADLDRRILAEAHGAPSALGQGIEESWRAISLVTSVCLSHLTAGSSGASISLSECAMGIGISGANNPVWKEEFIRQNPGLGFLVVDTDGFTTLLGAHAGKPGCVIAIGTGIVGVALLPGGERRTVGGWGFPSGDEASGSWFGLNAANYAQRVLDGRARGGHFSKDILKFCGSTPECFVAWLGQARQFEYAKLAPLVFKHAKQDRRAKKLLAEAAENIILMSKALDPSGKLPLALCGRIGEAMLHHLPKQFRKRVHKPLHNSAFGALEMLSGILPSTLRATTQT